MSSEIVANTTVPTFPPPPINVTRDKLNGMLPTDAIIRVTSSTICGSDLYLYNKEIPGIVKGHVMGHEEKKALLLSDIACTGWYANELGEIPIGLMVLAFAKHREASKIIVVDCITSRLAFASKIGTEIINFKEVKDVKLCTKKGGIVSIVGHFPIGIVMKYRKFDRKEYIRNRRKITASSSTTTKVTDTPTPKPAINPTTTLSKLRNQ
ncbi:8580_t:CDS:2 [Diversispora eburnea]|uniref:8580_t:CDS:1 n=1 Tax=Diversispora eburnea TaxID=1213867 RepID=A0A9N8UVY1_9GLOM|nr:8580_t:CDS:2 [Diversispora eburnea]